MVRVRVRDRVRVYVRVRVRVYVRVRVRVGVRVRVRVRVRVTVRVRTKTQIQTEGPRDTKKSFITGVDEQLQDIHRARLRVAKIHCLVHELVP